jgi:hypothetical protein
LLSLGLLGFPLRLVLVAVLFLRRRHAFFRAVCGPLALRHIASHLVLLSELHLALPA